MTRRPPKGMTPEEAEVDWLWELQPLLSRGGNLCEARTVDCLARPDGDLSRLSRSQVSIHHRKTRGMGGTRRVDVNELHHLLVVCGDGTRGCHGWIGREPALARERGLIVWQAEDARTIPLVLAPSGREVLLDWWYITVGIRTNVPGLAC